MNVSLLKRSSALLPIAMSVAALTGGAALHCHIRRCVFSRRKPWRPFAACAPVYWFKL
jgi:hypothetical protein